MTSSSAVPNIPKASQPLPASHCQVKHRHARGGRAPDVGGQREEGSRLGPTLTRQPLPGRRRSPRRCEIVFMRSARTRLADLFRGVKGCSERFPPLCVNVISHSTQNAPGTRNKKKNGCSDGPLNEQLLVPRHQAAWKNHVSCLFSGAQPTRPSIRFPGEWPIRWPSSYPCLGRAVSLWTLSLLFQSPFLFKSFSAFPAPLRGCLLLEAPRERPFCPFLSLVNISPCLCWSVQARLLDRCCLNTRVG